VLTDFVDLALEAAAEDLGIATGRRNYAGEHINGGSFTGTVVAQQTEHFALRYL